MNTTHYCNIAQSCHELKIQGKYFGIEISEILLATEVCRWRDDEPETQTLFQVIFKNLWDYRISSASKEPLLIDNEGFQHNGNRLYEDAFIPSNFPGIKDFKVPGVTDTIEGHAKARGWLGFPALQEGILPYRFIWEMYIFSPGKTCGSVEHSETLELVFDLTVLRRFLENGKRRSK